MRATATFIAVLTVGLGPIASLTSSASSITDAEVRAFIARCGQVKDKDCEAVLKIVRASKPRQRSAAVMTRNAAATVDSKPIPPPSEVINKWHTTLLIRDSFVPIAYITAPTTSADDLPQEGASFTYTRKLGDNSSIFVGKGAVMIAHHAETDYPFYAGELAPRISHVNLAPGFEFDTGVKNGRTFGQYSGIGAFEIETTHYGSNPFQLQYWRAKAVYTTDLDQNARVLGVETTWQPWAPTLKIGTMFQASEALDMWVGIFPTLNSDFYQVEKAGAFADLSRSQYWWVGPKVSGKLVFASGPLQPVSLYANYNYLYDVLNGSESTATFFRGGVKYQLTQEIGLEGRYTTGRLPRTLERIDEFYAGLTLKVGELR